MFNFIAIDDEEVGAGRWVLGEGGRGRERIIGLLTLSKGIRVPCESPGGGNIEKKIGGKWVASGLKCRIGIRRKNLSAGVVLGSFVSIAVDDLDRIDGVVLVEALLDPLLLVI